MRTLFTVFILVLVINVLALGALAGWLGATGRLSKERVREAVADATRRRARGFGRGLDAATSAIF